MGTCLARCWPPDPRSYQPIRSRYLPQAEAVQEEPRSRVSIFSSDDSLCLSDETGLYIESATEPSTDELSPFIEYGVEAEDDDELEASIEYADDATLLHLPNALLACYYFVDDQADDEALLTSQLTSRDLSDRGSVTSGPQPTTHRNILGNTVQAPSLASLADDSLLTNSLELEWEAEAGLAIYNKGITNFEGCAEEDTCADDCLTECTGSCLMRSTTSTPNSLEWDFRESNINLGGDEEGGWAREDIETEQLLQEIEQLAARALLDPSHDLELR